MYNPGDRKDTKAKNKTGGIIAAVIAIIVINLVSTAGASGVLGIVVFLLIVGGVIGLIAGIAKNAKKHAGNKENYSAYSSRDAEEDKVYVPMQDNGPNRTYYDSDEVFDNRERDKMRRIAQLKVFLENGIIEKDEYRVLLERYEREG